MKANPANPETKSEIRKYNYIEVLRGIAILFVVLYHTSTDLYTRHSYTFLFGLFSSDLGAVDLFFIISGFVLMLSNYKNIGKIDRIFPFIIKRIIRIFPVYWISLFIVILICKIWNPPVAQLYIYNLPFYLNNIFLIREPYLISPAWFISTEICLNILFIAVYIINRPRKLILYLTLYIFFILGLSFTSHPPWLQFFTERFAGLRAIEFILGIFAALFIIKRRNKIEVKQFLIVGITFWIAGFILMTITKSHFTFFPNWQLLSYGIPYSLILIGAANLKQPTFSGLNRMFIALGRGSYSIFLLHMVVLQSLFIKSQRLMREYGNGITFFLEICLIVLLSIVIPWIFYQVIEKKLFLYLRSKFARIR
jgi:peptidoglycan/LPS O-acetylase OafA/YrhL